MKDKGYRKAVLNQVENAGNEEIGESPMPALVIFVSISDQCTIKNETEILVIELFNSIDLPTHKVNQANMLLRWPAMLQLISTNSNSFLLDAAHNPSGLSRVLPELKELIEQNSSSWTLLFGTSPQRELDLMIDLVFDLCSHNPPNAICLTKPHCGRYPGVETRILSNYNWPSEPVLEFDNASMALEYLTKEATADIGLIVSIGSLYLQGNILKELGLDGDEELSLLPKQS